jgi:ABC-type Fe3+-siderophore transport system permease subunit
MMLAAGLLLGLGLLPPTIMWMFAGCGAVLVIALVYIKVDRQRWSLLRAIPYAVFFAALGFGLGYGLMWFLVYYLPSKPDLFRLNVPGPSPTKTAPW